MTRHSRFPLKGRSRSRWIVFFSVIVGLGLHFGTLAFPAHGQHWSQRVMQGLQLLQISTLSQAQEVDLGRQVDRQLSTQVRLSANPTWTTPVNQIGQQLARVSDRPTLPYTFRVVEDRDINAFATLGGFVYITTAALQAADAPDQIAAVLAHEIAHITEQHGLEQLQRGLRAQVGAQVLGLESSDWAAIAFELGVNRPHSREQEFVADSQGVELLRRAGYNPAAMAQFLAKLNQGRVTPTLFSTHPHIPDRIARLNQQVVPSPTFLSPPIRSDVPIMPLLPGVGTQERFP